MQSASDQEKASPAPMVEQAGEVIQADRDAAADFMSECSPYLGDCGMKNSVELALRQAFARHRLNTRPAPAETEGKTIYVRWADDGVLIRKWSHKPFEHGEPVTALSTPPADAGMLREALEQIELISTNHGGWFEDGAWEWGQSMGEIARDALTNELAALNSQAHQIRDGENGKA